MSVLIKGSHVKFEMDDGTFKKVPVSYGIIHDQSGMTLPKCEAYVGPYELTRRPAVLDRTAKDYFGKNYAGRVAVVDVPVSGPWTPFGTAHQIFYRRKGKYKAKYYHYFDKKVIVFLSKCGEFIRIELEKPDGTCVANSRGFVSP
jgi:hypothetical protein